MCPDSEKEPNALHSENIQRLIDSVEQEFGNIQYYSSSSKEEHGVAFKLSDIEVTFSVISLRGELMNKYDIQVEGIPPGDYVYMGDVNLNEFLELIRKFKGPDVEWP